MSVKPSYLTAEVAATFKDRRVATSYYLRPPHHPQMFEWLVERIVGNRSVLDIGCGTGAVARLLAPHVDCVDAVDMSEAMIGEVRRLPGGDRPSLRWIVGRV